MDYRHIYNQLIERAKGRKSPCCYTERHHILPRCLQGSDAKSNIVRLTAREHLLAHRLLVRVYPDNQKLFFALWSMLSMKHSDMHRISNTREYEKAKIQMAQEMSVIQLGKKKPPRTPEHRLNASTAQIGKILSESTKGKIRKARKSQITTDETRAKISASGTGNKNSFYGRKHSFDSKAKIKQNNKSNQTVCIDGIMYHSMQEAATTFGFRLYVTVKKRCLSDKWPTWKFNP